MRKKNDRSFHDANAASPTNPGTSRKRVRRACDDCRLRKARCDGRVKCETCFRHNRECSYNSLPTECKGSAARILLLERRLTSVREHIKNLGREQLPYAVDEYIFIAPQENLFPTPLRFLAEPGSTIATSTGLGLIKTLLKPLSHHEDIKFLISSDATRKVLCSSTNGTISGRPWIPFCRLPPYEIMLQVAHLAFNNIFGLPSIISERSFHAATQKLYDDDPIEYTKEHAQFVPLFCGVMTLGVLCQTGIELGHHDDLRESQHYFEMIASAIDDRQGYASISELQVGLVTVLYFFNISKLDLALRLLRPITSSSIIHAISQTSTVQNSEAQSDARFVDNILLVVHYLDMAVSSFLGLPSQLNYPTSTIYAINTAIRNTALCRRSDSTFLLSVSLAMVIESLKLIQSMMPNHVTGATNSKDISPDEITVSTQLRKWSDAEVELGTLESAFRRIFPDNDADPQISLARNELLMYLQISQIMLYHKFLLYHSQSIATSDPQQVSSIKKGRACVIAASNAISSASQRIECLQTTTMTWLSAYTIFISTIILLVATVSLECKDVYMQCNIEHTVRVAFQILKHGTYGQNRPPYMNFLLAVSAKTNVQFEGVLRNDISMAGASRYSSCQSESSRIESDPDPSSLSTHNGQDSSRTLWRSLGSIVKSPDDWGFD